MQHKPFVIVVNEIYFFLFSFYPEMPPILRESCQCARSRFFYLQKMFSENDDDEDEVGEEERGRKIKKNVVDYNSGLRVCLFVCDSLCVIVFFLVAGQGVMMKKLPPTKMAQKRSQN